MGGFFSLEGKFYKFGCTLLDVLIVGFLWTLFSLPLITIGASTTALYYVCTKKRSGDDVYIFRNFIRSFKENFLKSTAVFLILAFIGYVLWTGLHLQSQLDLGFLHTPVQIALWIVIVQVIITSTYAFAILSRFEMSISSLLRYSLFMGYKNFRKTLRSWFIFVIILAASYFVPFILLFVGGAYIYFTSKSFVEIFKQHSEEFESELGWLEQEG